MKLFNEEAFAIATIWQEARGESYDGKCAVGEVIRNRMKRRYTSDGTVLGTTLRPFQFSGWNTQDPNRIPALRLDDSDPLVQECKRAWQDSENTNFSKGAVLYLNPEAVNRMPDWVANTVRVAIVGAHHFYQTK
jgi:spore germination cell wall hydrolase CwlJ-like protein